MSLDNVVCWPACAGLLASVSRTDRRVAAKQSDECDVIGVFDVRPAAAAGGRRGGVEASLGGVRRSSAFDADRRQRRARRRPMNAVSHFTGVNVLPTSGHARSRSAVSADPAAKRF